MKDKRILQSKKIQIKRNRTLFTKCKIDVLISQIDGFSNSYIHLMWYDKKDKFNENLITLIDLEMTPKSHIKNIIFNDLEKSLSFVHYGNKPKFNIKFVIYFDIKKEYEILKKEIMKSLDESKIKYKLIVDNTKQTYIFNSNFQ